MAQGRCLPHLFVLFASLAVSLHTVAFDFVLYDDDYLVYRNPAIRDLRNVPAFFDPRADRRWMGSEYLPLAMTTFAIDHALWGDRAAGFHATSVALYAAGCVLLSLVLAEIFPAAPMAAAAGATLFALHPLHVESFAWVSDRKSLLNAAFVLLSLLGYVRWRRGGRALWYATSLAAFALATLSKATAASFPLALVAYDLLLAPAERPRRPPRDVARAVIPFFALAAAAGSLAIAVGLRERIVREPGGERLAIALATDPQILLRYLRLLALPLPNELCAAYLWPPVRGLTPSGIAGYAAAAALLAAAWAARRRAPEAAFAIAWFFVLLLPVTNLVPKGNFLAERYLFLPSIALAILAAWAWTRCPPRARLALAAGSLLVAGLLASASVARSLVWRSSFTLWEATLRHPLHDPNAYAQLGLAHLTLRGDPARAEEVLSAGLADMDRRGTPRSDLALTMRYYVVRARAARGDAPGARAALNDLGALSQEIGGAAFDRLEREWAPALRAAYPTVFR